LTSGNITQNPIKTEKFCALLHIARTLELLFLRLAAMNKVNAQRMRDAVTNVVEQSRNPSLSGPEAFRSRMQNQCRQIGHYRQAVLKETGRLLTPDEAALEWIERYAATFDNDHPLSEAE
jgi:hypothetical protein